MLMMKPSLWVPELGPVPCQNSSPVWQGCVKSRDHGWVVRRHAETGVCASGVVVVVRGWGGCDGCGGQADLCG
jgi:hypothetical protein